MFSIDKLIKKREEIMEYANKCGIKALEISKSFFDVDKPTFLIILDESKSFSETVFNEFISFLRGAVNSEGNTNTNDFNFSNRKNIEFTLLNNIETLSDDNKARFSNMLASAIPLAEVENRDVFEQLDDKLKRATEEAEYRINTKKRRASSFWEKGKSPEKAQKPDEEINIDETSLQEIAHSMLDTMREKSPKLWESIANHPETAQNIIKAIADTMLNEVNKTTLVFGQG